MVENDSTKQPMSLNVKNAAAHRLARELAELQGISLTTAVTDALREKLERERHRNHQKSLSQELLEIGKRCAAHVKKPIKSSDHAKMLYDRNGLPV
jgi:antitoxin VapB